MKYETIRGKKLYYQDVGQGYPILFGHSYLWSSSMWEPQIQALSPSYRCIVPDLWAHGQSESHDAYDINSMAQDHLELMRRLGLSTFHVVGLSVGGMWGTDLALNHPEHVSALVVMDSYVGAELKETKRKYDEMLNWAESAQCFPTQLIEMITPLFFSPHTYSSNLQLIEGFKSKLASLKGEQAIDIVRVGRAVFSRQCLLARLPELAMPTLFICGDDDAPRPVRESREMTSLVANSNVVNIPEAGHIANLEQPQRVSAELLQFLNACG